LENGHDSANLVDSLLKFLNNITTMLQTFLKNNLITLTDDQQLEKLKKSSQELVKRIKKEKGRI
jgi:hypothetical protein